MGTFVFEVEDITCGGCAASIQRGLMQDQRIESVEVVVPQKRTTVVGELSADEILAKLEALGFTPKLIHRPIEA